MVEVAEDCCCEGTFAFDGLTWLAGGWHSTIIIQTYILSDSAASPVRYK